MFDLFHIQTKLKYKVNYMQNCIEKLKMSYKHEKTNRIYGKKGVCLNALWYVCCQSFQTSEEKQKGIFMDENTFLQLGDS